MIDLSSALLSVLPPASAPVVVVGGAVASPDGFARTLGAFLDAKDAVLEPQRGLSLLLERQPTAEPGKDLPPESIDEAATPDASPLSFWFAPVPLPAAAIVPSSAPEGTVSTTVRPQAAPPSTADQPSAPEPAQDLARTTASAEPKVATVVPPVTADTPSVVQAVPPKTLEFVPNVVQRPVGVVAPRSIDTPAIAPDAEPVPTTVLPDATAQAIVVSTLPQPAGQVFASARAIAGSWREQSRRDDGRDQGDIATSFVNAAPIDLRDRAIVQAVADTAHTALDLTADTGLQRMIDRIETLRDTADAGDTRVRLIPDALGSIDVAVRQDGERVHVHFTAEHEATRALIAEAQPRLTDLAAARGLRIGETSVSTGTGDGHAAANPQPRPASPRAPISSTLAQDTDFSTDHRLA